LNGFWVAGNSRHWMTEACRLKGEVEEGVKKPQKWIGGWME
jgi:hypothetical protein